MGEDGGFQDVGLYGGVELVEGDMVSLVCWMYAAGEQVEDEKGEMGRRKRWEKQRLI